MTIFDLVVENKEEQNKIEHRQLLRKIDELEKRLKQLEYLFHRRSLDKTRSNIHDNSR